MRKQLNIGLTEEEKAHIRAVANSYGMTIREFVLFAADELEKKVTYKSNEMDEKRNRTNCAIITERINGMERKLLKRIDVLSELMSVAIKNRVIDIEDKSEK